MTMKAQLWCKLIDIAVKQCAIFALNERQFYCALSPIAWVQEFTGGSENASFH